MSGFTYQVKVFHEIVKMRMDIAHFTNNWYINSLDSGLSIIKAENQGEKVSL